MATPATTEKTWTIADLKKQKAGTTLYIKNVTPLMWTLHETVNGKSIDLELQGNGGIAVLPEGALDSPNIIRNHLKRKIVISPDLENEMSDQMIDDGLASQKRLADYMAPLTESPNKKALVEKLCLVCGKDDPRTGQKTGLVFQTASQVKAVVPPLCPEHLDQAGQFIPTLTSNAQGEETYVFSKPVTIEGKRSL